MGDDGGVVPGDRVRRNVDIDSGIQVTLVLPCTLVAVTTVWGLLLSTRSGAKLKLAGPVGWTRLPIT